MNERWTFLVIADEPRGTPLSIRVLLQDRDSQKQAAMQVTVGGEQIEVDDAEQDYEAPEWKAKQLLTEGGTEAVEEYVEALKQHLRSALSG